MGAMPHFKHLTLDYLDINQVVSYKTVNSSSLTGPGKFVKIKADREEMVLTNKTELDD